MFVGDGINDSPVLAQADVGVAINSGSDITVNAASIVLMKDSLYDVVNAIRISKNSF
jgi:P-type E1-E2 ATPase